MTVMVGKLISIGGQPFGGEGHAVRIYSRITRTALEDQAVILQLIDRIEMPGKEDGGDGTFTTADMDPGPIRVELEGSSRHGEGWDINLPYPDPDDPQPWSLGSLIDLQADWDPPVVSRAEAAAREAARQAETAGGHAGVAAAHRKHMDEVVYDVLHHAADMVRDEVKDDADRAETSSKYVEGVVADGAAAVRAEVKDDADRSEKQAGLARQDRTAAEKAAGTAAADAVQKVDEKMSGYVSSAARDAGRAETARQGAETIEQNLPDKVVEEVEAHLPDKLSKQLPTELAAQLPDQLNERVPPKVAEAIAADRAVADAAAAAVDAAATDVDLMERSTAETLIEEGKWYRGQIPENLVLDQMMTSEYNGIWTLSSGRATEMGMPRVVAYHVEVIATGNIVTQEATAHLSPPVIYMRRGRLGEWSMEWERQPNPGDVSSINSTLSAHGGRIKELEESGQGGVAREEDGWAMERRVREMDMRNRVGQVAVGQKGVVALVFDHATTNFRDIVFPALQERGLPATLALSPESHLDPRPTTGWDTATTAEIKQWAAAGIEIANHSGDHGGATGYDDMYRNIITSANTLEAELGTPVDSWVQPGYPTSDPNYDGFGRGYSPDVFYETTAGRMILRRHPMITGMDPDSDGDNVYPITGHPPLAIRRTGFDQKTDRARADIQTAIDEKGRTVVFCHPYAIYDDSHTGSFTTRSEFLAFLDWIVEERDAGRLAALTLREWAVAEKQVAPAYVDAVAEKVDQRIDSLHHYSGAGFPEGKVVAPVGSIYTDRQATSGAVRWIKASGTGNVGWRVEYGDTGWRDLSQSLINGWQGNLFVRRDGNLVSYRGRLSAASATHQNAWDIPTPFRIGVLRATNGYDYGTAQIWTDNNTPTIRRVSFYFDRFSILGHQPDEEYIIGMSYTTVNSWPATLPGAPA